MSASASDPAWQSEEVKQAFAAMEALSPFMSPQTATNKYPAGQQELALGEAAMYLNASWMPSEVADTAGEDFPWGFFAFPQVEDGAEGQRLRFRRRCSPGRRQRLPEPRGRRRSSCAMWRPRKCRTIWPSRAALRRPSAPSGPAPVPNARDVIAAADKVASLNCDLSSEFVSAVFTMEMNKVLTQQTTTARQGRYPPTVRSFRILIAGRIKQGKQDRDAGGAQMRAGIRFFK